MLKNENSERLKELNKWRAVFYSQMSVFPKLNCKFSANSEH